MPSLHSFILCFDPMARKSTATILVLVVACIIGYLVFKQKYLLTTALLLGLTGVLVPALAEGIHWAWMKLGEGLGYLTSRIILVLVFFLLLYPLALAAKLFRRKDIIKMKKEAGSYFRERNFVYTKESMENTW